MNSTMIYGRGVAALTAAWILAGRGFSVRLAGDRLASSLQLMLDPATVQLLDEVFGLQLRNEPFSHSLSRRIILGWNSATEISESASLSVPHDALVNRLNKCLQHRFACSIESSKQSAKRVSAQFEIHATGRNQHNGLSFGNRVATMAAVVLRGCWETSVIERTDYGWAFLVPSSKRHGCLFAVAANPKMNPADVLETTIKNCSIGQNAELLTASQSWRAIAPTLSHPLVTQSSIRIGESAFSLDPICGDGIGYAVRSALLAATVFADHAQQERRGLNYYAARLVRAFYAHLVGCAQMYAGWINAGWADELQSTQRGISYLRHQMAIQ